MAGSKFTFQQGNLQKLLALPKYLFGFLLAFFVPRTKNLWVFGSGIGVAEGALPVAQEAQNKLPGLRIVWLVTSPTEAAEATAAGFVPVQRNSWAGFWVTLRAEVIIVTHGLGDANRFGVFGAKIVQLWHGAPLKKLHFDSPVTTQIAGPAILRGILRKMYAAGAKRISLFVAGSNTAAARLRSAFRVLPGKVKVLGDPRDDSVATQAQSVAQRIRAKEQIAELVGEAPAGAKFILYAPTWRDGAADPTPPAGESLAKLEQILADQNAVLLVRSHPLGEGAYEGILGERIRLLGAEQLRDITPLLGAFELLITDYSSIAIDFSLLANPIIWFAPDLQDYESSRGLYEPLVVTAQGKIAESWDDVFEQLSSLANPRTWAAECQKTRQLATRFHAWRDGDAASRVVAEIQRLTRPAKELVDGAGIFFESFYGRLASCNPLALDYAIAAKYPEKPRYWSVASEEVAVPQGAVPLLIGSPEWFAARRYLRLLIVNDWLRFGFRRRRGQVVLQTWHGTMLKRLALSRPRLRPRTALAIVRESRRWSLMLSQNPHSTAQFKRSYAFRGRILETGYPRDDRLAAARITPSRGEHARDMEQTGIAPRNPIVVQTAKRLLDLPLEKRVLLYAPTWRDTGTTIVDNLRVRDLAANLGSDWVVLARGHSRTHDFGSYEDALGTVRDVSKHPDINDVMLAADLIITDYSSLMFDASVAGIPLAFYVPDLESYRDSERGFTFDFGAAAPGPLLRSPDEVVQCAKQLAEKGLAAPWVCAVQERYAAWVKRFNPHDDGSAAARVLSELERRGILTEN